MPDDDEPEESPEDRYGDIRMKRRRTLPVPRSGPGWIEGRDARRDRKEAALRALTDLQERAWQGRAWAEFEKVETYYRDAS